MKLTNLEATRYRSLKHVDVSLASMNVLIGANASGKSNVLDALRFLAEGVRAKEFWFAVAARGGLSHLAWKDGIPDPIKLTATFVDDDGCRYSWAVDLIPEMQRFGLHEQMFKFDREGSSTHIMESQGGKVWWWSAQAKNNRVSLKLSSASCALAAAGADESFPARRVAEFVERWGFFDPSPPLLRRAAETTAGDRLDTHGGNLAARLYAIRNSHNGERILTRIVTATRHILGVPESIDPRVDEYDGEVYFLLKESGLVDSILQSGVSSGTLRMLAFMTALFGETDSSLVGIEEPENHVHPSALKGLAEYLREASERVQIIVTTHSPILLDCLPTPEEVAIVRRTADGTSIVREENPQGVRRALEESGFSLGELHESMGFGT